MNNIQLERLGRLMRSMGDEACAVMISDAAEEAKSTCGIRDLAYSARHGNAARLALLAKVEQMALARGQHIAVGELVPADAYVSQASVETRRFGANAATVKELSPVSQSVDQQQAEVMTSKAQPPIDPGCPAARRVPLSVGDRAQALFIADVHVPMTPALRAEIMDITGEMASGAGLGVTTVPPDGDARAFADVEARNVSASLFVRWDEQALAVRIEWASVNLPGTESIEIVHNGAENRLRLARFHCAPPRTMVYADTAPPEWAQKLIGRIGAIRKAEGISDQLRIASADATWTVRCITNPARTRTVVVACEAKLAEFIASPLAALVDWVEITPETSIELQHRHGHAAAVPVAAIRMFQPGWQASDSAARHPWMLSDSHISDVWSVLFARDATPMAEATRVTIMQRAIDKLAALDASETRAARAEHDRSAATASAARATTDLEAALDVAAGHRREYESADAERRQMRGQIIALEQKIGAMVHHAVDLETRLTSVRPSMESWDDIQHWVVESLTSRLVLTPKALSAARSSVYRDFTFVADVLELLAGDYRSMRIGVAGARERYEEAAKRCGVETSGVGTSKDHRIYQDAYGVSWGGRNYVCDLHTSGSSSRHRTRAFRCYFAWDEERAMIVVGSLPEHLRSRES
ncbi:hypothetical protein B1A_03570 [mine drainage metagenome]|uniref:Uncharacterized protein n=2 Tax=mine drainage metagenome TaxID=410659 RepID=T1D0I5_9ZZZZ